MTLEELFPVMKKKTCHEPVEHRCSCGSTTFGHGESFLRTTHRTMNVEICRAEAYFYA